MTPKEQKRKVATGIEPAKVKCAGNVTNYTTDTLSNHGIPVIHMFSQIELPAVSLALYYQLCQLHAIEEN